MKVIRTANLNILKVWLWGGQTDAIGWYSKGFHCLHPKDDEDYPKTLEKTKDTIEKLILAYGDEPTKFFNRSFEYYDDKYRFKLPCEKNLNILAKRIFEEIKLSEKELKLENNQ